MRKLAVVIGAAGFLFIAGAAGQSDLLLEPDKHIEFLINMKYVLGILMMAVGFLCARGKELNYECKRK